MNFDYSEADEYESDFIATGAIEFDELDDGVFDSDLDAFLRVRDAHSSGRAL